MGGTPGGFTCYLGRANGSAGLAASTNPEAVPPLPPPPPHSPRPSPRDREPAVAPGKSRQDGPALTGPAAAARRPMAVAELYAKVGARGRSCAPAGTRGGAEAGSSCELGAGAWLVGWAHPKRRAAVPTAGGWTTWTLPPATDGICVPQWAGASSQHNKLL